MRGLEMQGDLLRRAGAALVAGLLAAVFTPVPAAGTPVTARELALGGAGATAARGVEALWANPANLAQRSRPGFSLMLLSATAGASNNSFTLDQYNRFTQPGTELSPYDKSEILASIPGDEFRVRAEAAANALGMTAGPFGFAVTPRVFGSVSLSKDYFELLFSGNELGRTYSLDGTSGESVAFFETALSYGRRTSWLPLRDASWGVSMKLFSGGAYFEVIESEGQLATYPDKATGEARVKVHYSGTTEETEKDGGTESEYSTSSGRGYGFDFGLSGRISSKWSTTIVLRDLGSRITWDRGTERSYLYQVDSLTVQNADEDDLIVDRETERPVESLRVSIPATLHMEFTRETPRFLFSTAYDQGFRNFAGVSTTPRLSIGTELRYLGWLPLRTGLSLGGGTGTCVAGGLGLSLGGFRLDFAGRTYGGLPGGGSRGGLVALTSYVRF